MTLFAIGQLNDGYTALPTILETIEFDKNKDTLWLAGNLFKNLEAKDVYNVFNFINSLGKHVISVMGDHDLKLLSYAEGLIPSELDREEQETFSEIIASPEHKAILKWLRQRAFMHYDKASNFIFVHAGIPAEWSLSQASTFAIEAETALAFGNHKAFFENTQKPPPRRWNAKLQGWKRLHFITYAFTGIRNCNEKGYMDFGAKVPASAKTEEYLPWYQQPDRAIKEMDVIFDHSAWQLNNTSEKFYPLELNTILKITDKVEMITV